MTSALDGDEWSDSHTGRFTSGDRAIGTQWIGGFVGPRTGLNAVGKKKHLTLAENQTPVGQLVARRYTD
jgi:hypothetical protein